MRKNEALHILDLHEGATDDDIKKAHRRKIRENHPDRFTDPTQKAQAEEKTKLINEARDVLISHTWTPDFDPRTKGSSPYSNPYPGNPFTGRPGATPPMGQNRQDPLYGIPFTYVWSSWDNIGADRESRGGSQTGNPFDPFASIFTQMPRRSAQELYEHARKETRSFTLLVAVKAGLLAFCTALGVVATGMFIYLIATVLCAISREVQGCSGVIAIPFVIFFGFPLLFMMPGLGASVSTGLLVFFGIAVVYDLGTLRQLISTMRTLKKRARAEH